MPQLFLDIDGVLADFDTAYLRAFGVPVIRGTGKDDPPGMWENIRAHGSFYRDMPLMFDAMMLWRATKTLHPVLLTGVPYSQVPEAEAHKRAWVRQHFGEGVQVICCRSRDKYLHGKPGDVLVDDWAKYQHLWVKMGGIFILHRSARETVMRLAELEWYV